MTDGGCKTTIEESVTVTTIKEYDSVPVSKEKCVEIS